MLWEAIAQIKKATDPLHASTLLPTIEDVFTKGLPSFSIFYEAEAHAVQASSPPSYSLGLSVLADNSQITILRVLGGIAVGLPAGLLLALVMAWNPFLRRVFYLSVEIMRMVPLLALAPLFVLWFGGAEIGNVAYAVFGIAMMMVVFSFSAIRNVPPIYTEVARTLGASKQKVFRSVVLPAILPELVGGIRVAIGFSWAIVLGAELLTASTGLGRLMLLSEQYGDVSRMMVILLLYMMFAFVLDRILATTGRRLTVWVER